MLGWGLRQTSSNDSGGWQELELADGDAQGRERGGRGSVRERDDDDDYNNRDFRGLEIAARAFVRSDI